MEAKYSLLHLTKLTANAYRNTDLSSYSPRISRCLNSLITKGYYACEVRGCPICNWKKNKEWLNEGQKAINQIVASNPKCRLISLSLSCDPFEVSLLKKNVNHFGESFDRLRRLKDLKKVIGYLKYLEIEKIGRDQIQIYLQCILLVTPSFYGGGDYVSNKKWQELWNKSLRQNDAIAKSKSLKIEKLNLEKLVSQDSLIDDMEWFIEYSKQISDCKFVTYGGVVGKHFKDTRKGQPRINTIRRRVVEPELLQGKIPEAVRKHQAEMIERMGEDRALIVAYQLAKEEETPETSRAVWNRVIQVEKFYTQPDHREKIELLAKKLESQGHHELARQAERIRNCAIYYNSNQLQPKLCRKRECPIFQYQRNLEWKEKFYSKAREFINAFSSRRWIFLTYKMNPVPVEEVRQALKHINPSFQRLTKSKEFPSVGWIRAINTFPNSTGGVEIEIKILAAFEKGFFGSRNYMDHKQVSYLWQKCLRYDYQPKARVQHLKLLDPSVLVNLVGDFTQEIDYTSFDAKEFIEFIQQVRRLKSILLGGEVKTFFQQVKLQRLPENWEEYFEYQVNNQSGGRVRPKANKFR